MTLSKDWQQAGLESGDTVLLHSDIVRTILRERDQGWRVRAQDILNSFIDAVGTKGTLLMPLFNFDFPQGIPFDMKSSRSQMGALTETARLHPAAVRTGHPIYSFAVIGKHSEAFRGLENFSGYGEDSPFGMLHKLHGKIAALNLPYERCMTFVHHVEEMENVPYRYHKKFTGKYTDLKGQTDERTFGLFVRDLKKGVKTLLQPLGDRMWELGLNTGNRHDTDAGLLVVSSEDLYRETSSIIREGNAQGMLYRLDP